MKDPVSREIVLPKTQKRIPFEEMDIGVMKSGISDPDHPDFDSLADWCARGDVLEERLPWMMFGFTDPSRLRVWETVRGGKNLTRKDRGRASLPTF